MGQTGGLEVEFKLKVPDQAALDALGRAAGGHPDGVLRQVNHFFDAADGRLNAAKYVLRLREENGVFFVTAKGPQTLAAGGTLSSKSEEELTVSSAAVAGALIAGTGTPLKILEDAAGMTPSRRTLLGAIQGVLAGAPLVRVGSFENQRTRWPVTLQGPGLNLPVVLEMDRTTFPGGVTHHEVEVEIPSTADAAAAQTALMALFARAGVTGESAPSKAKRFFAALAGKPI